MILIPTIMNTGTHFVVSLFGAELDVSRRQGMEAFDSLRPDIQQELIRRLAGRKDVAPGSNQPMVPMNIQLDPKKTALPDEVVFEHIPRNLPTLLNLAKTQTTVIPLRHPKVTAVSWKARDQDEQAMCDQFRIVVEQFDPLRPFYIPIDSEKRQLFLDTLSKHLGRELITDWNPIAEKEGNSKLRHNNIECSPLVAELCEEIKPFLDRFYD